MHESIVAKSALQYRKWELIDMS